MAQRKPTHGAAALALLSALASLIGCSRDRPAPSSDDDVTITSAGSDAGVAKPTLGPPNVAREIAVSGDLPVFYAPGEAGGHERQVFFHGACTHGLGYIQAFATTASRRGALMALQGEKACGGGLRIWTSSSETIDRRVDAGFAASGDDRPAQPVVAIGYSQGATVAEGLAARFPAKYRRLILIGAPRAVDARRLRDLEGAVLMAGTFDNRAVMKESMRALQSAGVPATFIEIPGARHGQLLDAERVMGEALDWLASNARHPSP